ncbi:hypothetical protein B9J93_03875 [Vibrio sp. V17_P4S1T151]|uniref:hypothetical protein n=1 Tax=unclassified Vibrio TaxID=2614977 RepID=UPI000B8E57DC|nr:MULTISPECIES: hypothetical protein [unclassified Vibrio]OXX48806.1 hypothetical protein B9J93_03875 [Vibrio sp. V17_P4S1T151]OXX64877.1 hypothetical protein B9J89_03105 [Vibrio sp. V15_P4S5T153]
MLTNLDKLEAETKSVIETARNAENTAKVVEQIIEGADQVAIDSMIDVENASLSQVSKFGDSMNADIVNLIHGLDNQTNEVGAQLSSLQEEKLSEKIVGVFFKKKAREMRAERIKTNDISDNLNELINQSNRIKHILEGQRDILREKREIGLATLENAQKTFVEVVAKREEAEKNIRDVLAPALTELELQMREAADQTTRAEFEAKVSKAKIELNDANNEIQKLTSKGQSLEKYISMHKTAIDSLSNQLNNQIVLIEKLTTDTEHRTVIYDQFEHSLKTADQQMIAHAINDIGAAVDNKTQEGMAAIGAATNRRMAETLESHKGHMANSTEILRKKQAADKEFYERFGKVLDDHKAANYN